METLKIISDYDGLGISVLVNRPKGAPVAAVQLIHGMCGCKERFYPIMNFLADNGVACITSDLRGHGQSVRNPGDRGYFYAGGYRAMVADTRAVTNWGLKTFPETPFFLLGHSMGSLVARCM